MLHQFGLFGLTAAALLWVACKPAATPVESAPPPRAADSGVPTEAQPRLPTLRLYLGQHELITELAQTGRQIQTGMMFRTNMANGEAMLFVFPNPEQRAFWMKNTLIPLDVAYLDADGTIVEIHPLQPLNTNSVISRSHEIQFVIETPQNWFAKNNVPPGTVVRTEKGSLRETFSRRPTPR